MNISEARASFPHLGRGFVHLNHAGVSPLSTVVVDPITKYLDLMQNDPPAGGLYGWSRFNACRDAYARLLGVLPEDVALTKNTAHGVSIVADGIDWREGDEIVFADCEYPANTYPWLAQQSRGAVCRIVPMRGDGSVTVDDFRASMSPRTRVLAVSWVQFATGYRCDLAAIGELCREHGCLFVVDVIQGLGAHPMDVNVYGIDIVSTGSQKWLMGPVGVGALMVTKEALNQIRLVNMGAMSVKDAIKFSPLGFDPKTTAQRHEEGTPNILGACGTTAAIGFLESFGIANVEARVLAIAKYAADRLSSKGYDVGLDAAATAWPDERRSGIVLFSHPSHANADLLKALESAKVIASERGGRVRFAPHFYNTEADIDHAIAALP